MLENKFYEEIIFSKLFTGITAIFSTIFLFLLSYQMLIGPIGTSPALNWFFLFIFLFFLGITINFSRLTIRMTSNSIKVGYGISKYTILWKNIEDCYLDKTSIRRYGGWGIRLSKVKGKWRLVYNVIGYPRVLLSLNQGKFREFVFSTKTPEEVIKIIKQRSSWIERAIREDDKYERNL